MPKANFARWAGAAALLIAGGPLCGGSSAQSMSRPATPVSASVAFGPARSLDEALYRMAARAGVIFLGEVISVERAEGDASASGTVRVSFRVEYGIRGVNPDSTYVLKEWAGLWAGNTERYRRGQRLLMLLHGPGPSGLSSPVGGTDGAIPIAPPPVSAFPEQPVAGGLETAAVDLRWIAAQVMKPLDADSQSEPSIRRVGIDRVPCVPTPRTRHDSTEPPYPQPVRGGPLRIRSGSRVRRPSPEPGAPVPTCASTPIAGPSADLANVILRLEDWERSRHETR